MINRPAEQRLRVAPRNAFLSLRYLPSELNDRLSLDRSCDCVEQRSYPPFNIYRMPRNWNDFATINPSVGPVGETNAEFEPECHIAENDHAASSVHRIHFQYLK